METMKYNITGNAEILIDTTIEKVWEALTDPALIKQYFFGTNTKTDWKPGSPITFSGEWKGKTYEDKGTILDFQKYKLIKYSYWSENSGIITQENIPSEEMKEHSEENWKQVMNNLKKMLEKDNFRL
jgi:uncharacterized protein YndB with AHSA1/START domain